LLEVGKVYNIKCFTVARAKSLYKVTSAPFMILLFIQSLKFVRNQHQHFLSMFMSFL
jgi:hypothetical protein